LCRQRAGESKIDCQRKGGIRDEAVFDGSVLLLVAVTLLDGAGTSVYGQGQAQGQAPPAVRSRAEETLGWGNQIGNKLIAMAKDFPEDRYDFKVQKDQRTFAQNLLHVAAIDYYLINKVSEPKIGPDLRF
jgi:hypothetical protein